MDTYEEMCVKLVLKVDMIELLELLNITVTDIVERYEDRIEINREDIEEYLNELAR